MNVPLMQMDTKIAKEAYRAYHHKVLEHRAERRRELSKRGRELGQQIAAARIERTRLEREDEDLMRAYQAMAKGSTLISLPQVMAAAGAQPTTFYPALGLARATWKDCFFQLGSGGVAYFSEERSLDWRAQGRADRGQEVSRLIRVPRSSLPSEVTDREFRKLHHLPSLHDGQAIKAIVPLVPAHLRPANLEQYFILWDAVWEPAPPIDPLLLKPSQRVDLRGCRAMGPYANRAGDPSRSWMKTAGIQPSGNEAGPRP